MVKAFVYKGTAVIHAIFSSIFSFLSYGRKEKSTHEYLVFSSLSQTSPQRPQQPYRKLFSPLNETDLCTVHKTRIMLDEFC